MKELIYKITYALFYMVSLLPYRALYVLSDFFYVIVRLSGYRRRVVRHNIETAFPEKSTQEHRQIERRFYRWLCDYFVETVKLLSVSRETLLKHIEFRGTELVEECFDHGQNCGAMLGHYGNWELLSATGLAMTRHTDAVMGLIYHPLRSDLFDRLFIDIRQCMGGVCIPKKDILRYLVGYKRENRMNLFGYISDQAPKWENIHLWIPFLHHDTPVFTGAERIMRKMQNAVFYVDMERPRRGHYLVTFKLITTDPQSMEEHAITRRFFEMLEETIRREPSCYLWSHDRWRRTHEEFNRRYEVVNGKVIQRKES